MINDLMRSEILDQPEAWRQTLPSLRSQLPQLLSSTRQFQRVIFTGSGDSYFAPLALEYAAHEYITLDVHICPALSAARYWPFSEQDLLVAISISGEAARTLEAAKTAQQAGARVLAITANEASSLAANSHSTAVIPFHSRSRQTPHTTDYLTSLLAVALILETLGQRNFSALDSLADEIAQSLQSLEKLCSEVGEALVKQEFFYFLGAGPSFGTAQYAAAKFWEAGGLRAFAFELEEFAHGPHLLVDEGDPVFVIAPSGNSLDRAKVIVKGLAEIGVNIYAISDDGTAFPEVHTLPIPSLAEEWSPFFTSLPVQWLCWAISSLKGYDVLAKDGRHQDPAVYEAAHRAWVRG